MEKKMRNISLGSILKMELVEERKLTENKIAELLETTEENISNIFNGKASISEEMALRLEKKFGGTANHFLKLQSNSMK